MAQRAKGLERGEVLLQNSVRDLAIDPIEKKFPIRGGRKKKVVLVMLK